MGNETPDSLAHYTVLEARVLTERWRREYNEVRPHSALGYRLPAPVAVAVGLRRVADSATLHPHPCATATE